MDQFIHFLIMITKAVRKEDECKKRETSRESMLCNPKLFAKWLRPKATGHRKDLVTTQEKDIGKHWQASPTPDV